MNSKEQVTQCGIERKCGKKMMKGQRRTMKERERERRDDNMMLTWCYVMEEKTFPLLVCVRWRNFLDWLTACGHQHLTRWQKHLEAFIIIGWSGNMKVQVEDTQWLFHFWRLNVEKVLIIWEVNTYIGTVVSAVAFCTRGRSSNQDIVKFESNNYLLLTVC